MTTKHLLFGSLKLELFLYKDNETVGIRVHGKHFEHMLICHPDNSVVIRLPFVELSRMNAFFKGVVRTQTNKYLTVSNQPRNRKTGTYVSMNFCEGSNFGSIVICDQSYKYVSMTNDLTTVDINLPVWVVKRMHEFLDSYLRHKNIKHLTAKNIRKRIDFY